MQKHGFAAYPYEFWHYNAGDAYAENLARSGKAARYGPIEWHPGLDTITSIRNPAESLNSLEELESLTREAMVALTGATTDAQDCGLASRPSAPATVSCRPLAARAEPRPPGEQSRTS